MSINEDNVYILNPDYILKSDECRVVMFSKSKSNHLSVPNWESFLHPVHAQIFSFFTHQRPLRTTLLLLSDYLHKDLSVVKSIVSPFIENPLSVYTRYKDTIVRIPKNAIIDRNQIDGAAIFLNLDPGTFCCSKIDLSSRRTLLGPQLLTFMLNNTCIANCIYCYADTKTKVEKTLSTTRIIELIEEAKKLPVGIINLMGGEIFLHPDWRKIVKTLVQSNLSPEYISTKYPLSGNLIHSIQRTGFVNPLQISLDACSSALLRKMLSVKNDYLSKVLSGVKKLDNSGLKYRINTVLTTINTKREVIEELFQFVRKLKNISDWRITPAVDSNWIETGKFNTIKPKKEKIESVYKFITNEVANNLDIPIILNHGAIDKDFHYCTTGSVDFKGVKCSALHNQLFILPDGKVTICEQLYWSPRFIVGDVLESSIRDVWNSPAAQQLLNITKADIQNNSRCKMCDLFGSCFKAGNRCWVDIVKAYGINNWDYPDPRCAFAPAMDRDLRF
jgi:radical SAM protein with 4Fe4S-binding SPASM domain